MKKIIKLTESQLTNIIKRVLQEQTQQQGQTPMGSKNPLWIDLSKKLKTLRPSHIQPGGFQMGNGKTVTSEAIHFYLDRAYKPLPGYNYGVMVHSPVEGDINAELYYNSIDEKTKAKIEDFLARNGYSKGENEAGAFRTNFSLQYYKPEKLVNDLKNLFNAVPLKGSVAPVSGR